MELGNGGSIKSFKYRQSCNIIHYIYIYIHICFSWKKVYRHHQVFRTGLILPCITYQDLHKVLLLRATWYLARQIGAQRKKPKTLVDEKGEKLSFPVFINDPGGFQFKNQQSEIFCTSQRNHGGPEESQSDSASTLLHLAIFPLSLARASCCQTIAHTH